MSGPLGSSQFMYSTGSAGFYDYQIEQSCRFDHASDSSLTKTFSSDGNRKKFTYSVWIKPSYLVVTDTSNVYTLFGGAGENDNGMSFYQSMSYNQLDQNLHSSSARLRDPNAWTHMVYAVDIDNSTAAYRFRVYVNGTELTDWGSDGRSSMSGDKAFNKAGSDSYIGDAYNSNQEWDGYMAEIIFLDGTQATPSSFSETKNGVWVPKDPSSLTFGSNGVHLKFQNASALGDDSSGNNNDWTANNMGADHQVLDSPTNGTG